MLSRRRFIALSSIATTTTVATLDGGPNKSVLPAF